MEKLKPRYSISKIGAKLSRSYLHDVAITHLSRTYQMSYAGMQSLASALQMNFSWKTEEIQMLVSTNHLWEFVDPELQGLIFEDLPGELQTILVQVLGKSLEDIFAQFKQTLTLKSGKLLKNTAPIACLNISDGSRNITEIGIVTNPANSAFWDAIIKVLPKKQGPIQPLSFRFKKGIGGLHLPLSELKTLKIGDILLNQWQKNFVLFSYENFSFLGKQDKNNISVIKKLMSEKEDLPAGIIPEEPNEQNTEEVATAPASEGQTPVQAKPTVSLNDLPVKVIFQAGQQTLSLEQLQQLQEGYVFELEPNADETILIVANGKTIGQGRWIQVEDHTGVQITHLAIK